MLKNKIIDAIIEREDGYVNDPLDAGGETMFGVTRDVARSYGYTGQMQDMPRRVAEAVYADLYWNALHLDVIAALSDKIAAELADTAVNMGVGIAGRFLQVALNAFNDRGLLYSDIPVDGLVGPKTVAALRAYLGRRAAEGEAVMLAALNTQQGARYLNISERRPDNERFTFGWFAHRVVAPALPA